LTRSQAARQERMLDVASRLAGDGGFDNVQMRAVAAEAEVALGTLYRYFPSKEQLFATALIRWVQTFEQSYERSIRSAESDPVVRLRRTLGVALKGFERSPRFFGLLIALQSSDDPEVAARLETFTGTTSSVVRDALEGVDERWIEPIETLVWAAVFNLLRGWSFGAYPMAEVRRRLDECVDVIFGSPLG